MRAVFGIFTIIDIVTSMVAALSNRYDAAIYYVLLGLLFTIVYAISETEDVDDD